jgi:hypothetical protein
MTHRNECPGKWQRWAKAAFEELLFRVEIDDSD